MVKSCSQFSCEMEGFVHSSREACFEDVKSDGLAFVVPFLSSEVSFSKLQWCFGIHCTLFRMQLFGWSTNYNRAEDALSNYKATRKKRFAQVIC